MLQNLKHAARNGENVTAGGGVFSPAEVREFVKVVQDALLVLDECSRVPAVVKDSHLREDLDSVLRRAHTLNLTSGVHLCN